MKISFKGASFDSLALTFVKIISAMLGLVTTKLLSTYFSLQEYGTYTQAMLIVSSITSFTILGLSDATNYFYNSNKDELNLRQYISTIFGIQYIVGGIMAIVLLFSRSLIVKYFNNDGLLKMMIFVAWMPMLNNILAMLQVLFVSIKQAKKIAIRNFVISVARLAFVVTSCYVTNDISTVIVLMLILDVCQVLYFHFSFSKDNFRIRFSDFNRSLIIPILRFSIPMAVYVFTHTLSRDVDKYVISYFTDTETVGIYTNGAKALPFDMLTLAFLTVLIPIITRQIKNQDYTNAQLTLKRYLRISYLSTWILTVGAIFNSKELMCVLYDSKFLPGLNIFRIYLLVDMIKFANISLVLSAKGKTKILMFSSVISLGLNFLLNIAFFKLFGIIGPAISTLLITFGLMTVLLWISAKEIKTNLIALFSWKEIFVLAIQLIIVGLILTFIKSYISIYISSLYLNFVVFYGLFIAIMLLLSRKRIISCLKELNQN